MLLSVMGAGASLSAGALAPAMQSGEVGKSAKSSSIKPSDRALVLQVEAIWHEEVHQSRISCLAVSEDGSTLYSGCDAAAPRPLEGPDFPAAAVAAEDGRQLQTFAGAGLENIRLVLSQGQDQLHCLNDQGIIVRLTASEIPAQRLMLEEEDDKTQEGVQGQAEGPQAPADAAEVGPIGEAQPGAAADASTNAMSGSTASTGPEYLPETGYRGAREGYIFRSGLKGLGYYRKDVVRLYAPTRTRSSIATADAACAADSPASEAASGGVHPPASTTENGGQAASVAADGAAYLQRLLRAKPGMQSAVVTPDGSLLITASLGSKDHCLRVWALPADPAAAAVTAWQGEEGGSAAAVAAAPPQQPMLLRTLSGHTAAVLSLALSPDGSLLFSGSYDYTIRAWRTSDWACVRVLKGHGGGVHALAVSPDGSMLYSAAGDNTLRAWSTKLWVGLRTLHGRHEETTWPCCMALSPDGELLASGSNGLFGASTIKVFKTRSGAGHEAGACLATFAQLGFLQKGAVSALAFSPDGTRIYSGASDGTLAAWRLNWVDAFTAGKGLGLRKGFF